MADWAAFLVTVDKTPPEQKIVDEVTKFWTDNDCKDPNAARALSADEVISMFTGSLGAKAFLKRTVNKLAELDKKPPSPAKAASPASPTKRKAPDAGRSPSPAKKGGGKGKDWKNWKGTKADFLKGASNTVLEFELLPKVFGNGGHGYQRSGGMYKIDLKGDHASALGVDKAYSNASGIGHFISGAPDSKEFFTEIGRATDRKFKYPLVVSMEAIPCEFSSGSFGWHAHCKQEVTIAKKTYKVNVNFNATVCGSKEIGTDEKDKEIIDSAAAEPYLKILGQPRAKAQDLTDIRGIGPWIQARLYKLKINSFEQIAKMDLDMQHKIAQAIKYFPDRMIRDEWVYQAQKKVSGDWDKLNPLFPRSGTTQLIEIDGKSYKRALIDLANSTMSDGVIEFWEAEALWWLAVSGGVSDTGKTTLEYILSSDKYKFDEDAKAYMKSKMATLA